MKIHFFTKRNEKTGSSRQRAFWVADEIVKRGGEADVHRPSAGEMSETPWPQKWNMIWTHIQGLREIKRDDVIYFQRPIANKYLVLLIVLYRIVFRRKMIFDMDDAVFRYMPYRSIFFTKLSDAVIAGSHYLADWLKKYNKNVHIVPTAVHFEKYSQFTRDYGIKNEKLTIGWIGGANYHYENLKLLVPVFEQLAQKNIPVKFILIGASGNQKVYELFNQIKNFDVEFIDALDWTIPTAVPSNIQKFDIGLMPLTDDESTRGKCAFKAIEYMACGVVPIISPVGENTHLVQDGVNGFLANEPDEWVEKIIHAYQHPEESAEMGRRAQQTIKERYSFDAIVPQVMKICRELSSPSA